MKKSKRKENLINEKEIAFKCQDLARIRRDAPVAVSLADLTYTGPDHAALVDLYQELDFKSFLTKLTPDEATAPSGETAVAFTPLTAENLAAVGQLKAPLTLHLEQSQANYHLAKVEGFALGRS